jgi:hypothetical protein
VELKTPPQIEIVVISLIASKIKKVNKKAPSSSNHPA